MAKTRTKGKHPNDLPEDHMTKTTTALGVTLLLGLAACMPAKPMPDAPDRAEGAAFFAQNCVQCHGRNAQGDGAAAKGMQPHPRDLTLLARDNGGRFPQTKTLAYIYGDPDDDFGGSHLKRVMPNFGEGMALDLVPVDLDGQLTPTPRVLAGLLVYLESIQR
ncbi:c-type cytochrome [Sulfitobacter sp. BSw21498]|uniref:c-type cytochrome n=1 Tax=Sulfitobacter sp. BSw21498 TaxID=664426 RepID=UPI001485E7A9|nr:c-type cytochrome [Sulfitobacter sp. BSw21498]|tara:strand:- start:40 stop:525 length:486 start_codon:yes stop_codon:yes gene_type:complete